MVTSNNIFSTSNDPPGNSIKEYDNFKECEEALITGNAIENTNNGNKAELLKIIMGSRLKYY